MAKTTIAVLEERVSNMKTTVDHLDQVVLQGNGESLVSKIGRLTDFMNDYKWLARTVIVAVIANLVGFAFSAYVWVVKIAPYLDRLPQIGRP